MPEPHQPPQTQQENNDSIRILQINLNKSEKAHLDIINENVSKNYDLILIQEPYTTTFNAIRTPANFRPIYPINRLQNEEQIRSVIWVNKRLDTKDWTAIDVPDTNDVTAIQLKGPYGKLTIFNIYNDCTHSRSETTLRRFLNTRSNSNLILRSENHHMLWAGDFNRHHPLWDNDEDVHLFTQQATRQAEALIGLLATYDLTMTLPKGIPTLQHMVTKKYSRPDNVFGTPALMDHITKCEVEPSLHPTSTDHFPIVTNILLPQERVTTPPSYNFREADWDKYREKLRTKLTHTPAPPHINDVEQLTAITDQLTLAIQETTQEVVQKTKPRPDAKRWWNSDLKKLKKELNRLRSISYRNRALAHHPSHQELKQKSNAYGEAIVQAKRQHWTNYLEEMTATDIWTANKFVKEPAGDGGCPRIPTLKIKDDTGQTRTINDNEEKSRTFARTFFPPPPPQRANQEHFEYPAPLPDPPQITTEQVHRHIAKLSPYKAYGPDGIPNVVLQRCADIITERLTIIFRAIIELGTYYDPWREFTTVVLRKPGKPCYETPKAYRPIALISTMAKVLTSIVAENLSHIVELHQLLPKTHFGGRPGRSTADAVHYLVHKVCAAWREDKVVSVLFLDVEGAFPNAVTSKLIHNLKKRKIPTAIVSFITQLLHNRRTRLRFDDHTSELINITNGIGQGDPLSMLLYIIYNADLLDLPDNPLSEDAIGYVDDVALLAIGEDFEETTHRLETIMKKDEGGLEWSKTHNSRFEVTKSAILHLSRKTKPDPDNENSRIPLPRPALILEGQIVKAVENFKYLGIQIDAQLRWKEQAQRATANATKWILQFRRLTKITTGVNNKLMRQLYLAVALPKINYGVDVWYTPPSKPVGYTKNIGSVGALRNLKKSQRIAALAITGTLRTTPNDFIDIHAGIYPMEIALLRACHNATVRMLTLPKAHPLHQIITKSKRKTPTKHLSPIDSHLKRFDFKNIRTETIHPPASLPRYTLHNPPITEQSREASINYELLDDADYKIFSDGSGHDNGIGAAAILYRKDRATPLKSLQAYLGTPNERNTYEAEVTGAILALWIISNTPETVGKKVTLYTDNQSVIAAILSIKATSGQHLINSLRLAINTTGCNLTIRWISSHSKVKGNEAVDKIAKKAAEGRSSATATLPHILRRPLPKSTSAIKQEFERTLKEKWAAMWDASPRKPRIAQLGGHFPFNSFRKILYTLTRQQASLILQLRSGHFPLNKYLHKINRADTDKCTLCTGNQLVPTTPETINHFLFECQAHAIYRDELIAKIGIQNFHLPNIMKDANRIKHLVTFINRTGRFKK